MNADSESERPLPLRTRIRQTTVDAILSAAEEVFADAGLHAARMSTIADRAGVSVGTLYNHFQDRDSLVAGLLAARRAELLGRIDAATRAAARLPLRARLRAILEAFFGHYQRHRKFVSIVLQHDSDRLKDQGKADTMRAIYERIAQQLRRGLKERALRPDHAALAPAFFMGMLRALVMRQVILGIDGDLTSEIEPLLDVFFDGMGRKRPA